ncbi:MAG: GNAT family N-acetyltransferase [Sphingomonadales bacterium]|nr:GNAT family N-acetyltransferase [Sphingomonadales bacterium]MDE2569682.1 GNAT family N-acetyltransferase [Sphingomonadales bacterium]
MARDLTQPKVVDAWLRSVEEGRITSYAAIAGGRMVGYTALISDDLSWSPHVGEIRVIVADNWRGKGVGRRLVEPTFRKAIEKGLEKLTARMTTDQHGAINMFEDMGFRAEAMLRDQVRARDGKTYDLAILSLNVAASASGLAALGITEALS